MKKFFPLLFGLAVSILFLGIFFGIAGAFHTWMFIVSGGIFLLVFSLSSLFIS